MRRRAPFGRGPFAARVLRLAILGASAAASRLPPRVLYPLARLGGTVEWAVRPRKRAILARHLAHAVALPPDHAEVRRLVRSEVLNEARRSADFLWAIAQRDALLERTEVVGLEHVRETAARGRGLVLASLHLGGWEVVASLPAQIVPVPTSVIVTDDWLAWAVSDLREAVGLRLIYDTEPATKAVSRLRAGEAVLVLCDYAKPGMRTYPVRLLDGACELPAGPAALARLAGSPVVPFAVVPGERPRSWRIEVEPPLEPPARTDGEAGEADLLQRLADRWTEQLRRHPEHWAAVYPMRWHPG